MVFKFLSYLTLIIHLLILINSVMISENVNNVEYYVSTVQIEAENYTWAYDVDTLADCADPSTSYVGAINASSLLFYRQVDFSTGVNRLNLRVANTYSGPDLYVLLYLGNYTTPILTIPVAFTGDQPCAFATQQVILDAPLAGVQDVRLLFLTADAPDAFSLDWFVFEAITRGYTATEKIEAEDYTEQYYCFGYYCSEDSGYYMVPMDNTAVIRYDHVDFGSGVEMLTLRVTNMYEDTTPDVSLHLGDPTNPPFVTLRVGQTGNDTCDFFTLQAFLDTQPTGVQDLVFTFYAVSWGYLNIDWFVFNKTVANN